MHNFGIRNKATGNVIETFEDPILAQQAIIRRRKADAGKKSAPEYEIVEKTVNNIYSQIDGRTYITGTETIWSAYEVKGHEIYADN